MGISMLKIRRSRDRLIFLMEIPILVRRHLYIETAARVCIHKRHTFSHPHGRSTGFLSWGFKIKIDSVITPSHCISVGLAGRKHYQKDTLSQLQNYALSGCFLYSVLSYILSLLSSGWVVIAVCGSISVQGIQLSFRHIVHWSVM